MTKHQGKRKPGNRRGSARRRRERNRKILILLAVVLVLVLIVVGVIVFLTGKSPDETKEQDAAGSEAAAENAEEEEQQRGLQFPYELEDGKLVVASLFQSDIMNPDCNDEMGEEIASLEIVNQSGKYLSSASFKVTMEDRQVLNFKVSDVPNGKSVWAFETGNTSISSDAVCELIECETQYEEEAPLMADQIAVEVSDTSVTLTNLTDEDLTNLVVDCHCLFEEAYFGGLTYTYPVDVLSAGGTAMIEADDCYMGNAEVVRITQGN